MNLINPYHYLYTKIYITQFKSSSAYSDVNFNVCIAISLATIFNFLTLNIVARELFGSSLMSGVPKILYGIFVILWFVFNYFYFSFKNRYEKILEEFNFFIEIENPKSGIFGVLYLWGSVFVLIFSGFSL